MAAHHTKDARCETGSGASGRRQLPGTGTDRVTQTWCRGFQRRPPSCAHNTVLFMSHVPDGVCSDTALGATMGGWETVSHAPWRRWGDTHKQGQGPSPAIPRPLISLAICIPRTLFSFFLSLWYMPKMPSKVPGYLTGPQKIDHPSHQDEWP